MKPATALVAMLVALPVLAACDRPPQPPDKTAPPEPQAALRNAVPTPIERAERVQTRIDEAARQQRTEIEAAGG